jgi:MFS family permease
VQLGNLILIVALPTIQQDLGASPSELQWMVDAYTLVFAALLFTSGSREVGATKIKPTESSY